jgi:uncharacterized protein (TIGR03545 family)
MSIQEPPATVPSPKDRPSMKRTKKKGWIRWPGLVTFVLITGLIVGVWLVIVDALVKRMIEKTGTKIVGAKVELGAADLSLFPLGLTLTRLQVTNPDEPMTNAVEVARIAFTMDGLNLLRRKVLIEEMSMAGMRFHTPRTTSGAIAKPAEPPPGAKKSAFSLPSVQLRDPREILKNENLQSLKVAEALKTDIQAAKDRWQEQLAVLPDKAKFADYKKRIEGVKSSGKGGLGGILGGASEAVKIQEDVRKDLDQIRTAQKEFEETATGLRRRMDEAVRAPEADLRRLQEKYSLSPQGLTNAGAMLLGGQIGDWTRTGLRWYRKLQPMFARYVEQKKANVEVVKPVRGKGLDVRYKEHAPLPDFLIRLTHASVEIPAGVIKGQIRNITPDQHVLGKPLTFDFAAEKLQGLHSVNVDGALNHVNPAKPTDQAAVRLRGYQVGPLTLAEGTDLPLLLKQGVADLDLRTVLSGEALNATLSAKLQSVQMTSGLKADAGPLAQAVSAALSDVHGFSVKADVAGTLDHYDVRLTSDLDRVLSDVVKKQLQAQMTRLEGQLRAAIMEKVNGPLNEAKASFGGLDGVANELAGRLNLGNELLQSSKPGGFKLPF